ncbi:hypothetical protein [Actinomadura nitritigenes]|uniref:hypothetical protein n=1 Tax=Actinomadura nitritigenes TaxID=134602 RepID=UPI003D8C91D3
MSARDDLKSNVDRANEQLDAIKGDHPTDVVQTHMAIATVFMLGALVNAVQELTEVVRKASAREAGPAPEEAP